VAEVGARTVESLPADWPVARLAAALRAHLPALRARYHLDTAALFGSYVRNEQRPESDLDVLVTFSRTPNLFDLVRLEDELAAALGVPVDVVLRSELGPRITRYVMREAIEL